MRVRYNRAAMNDRIVTKRHKIRHWKIPLLLVGLAYLLRTFSLDWQSFWLDEVRVVTVRFIPLGSTSDDALA